MRAFALCALLSISVAAVSAPFQTRDQNPLLAGFGSAESLPARIAGTSFDATLNWSSTSLLQNAANESLTLDAESQLWQLALTHAFNDSFAIHVQLPYRTTGGGSLDHFIENWHSFFGLPNGDRGSLPKNDFLIDYQRNGASTLRYSGSRLSGIGDLSIAAGYQWRASPYSADAFWWTLKLPTGSSSHLTGSGALDTTIGISHVQNLSGRWTVNANASATYLGKGDLLTDQQRRWLLQGMVGIDYQYSNALTLSMQLDAHTAAFSNTGLNLLGDAWLLTLGGSYRFASQWQVQLGVSEDVKVDSSPDVDFVMRLRRSF